MHFQKHGLSLFFYIRLTYASRLKTDNFKPHEPELFRVHVPNITEEGTEPLNLNPFTLALSPDDSARNLKALLTDTKYSSDSRSFDRAKKARLKVRAGLDPPKRCGTPSELSQLSWLKWPKMPHAWAEGNFAISADEYARSSQEFSCDRDI